MTRTTATFTSHPVDIGGSLRMMAGHLIDSLGPEACGERKVEVRKQVEGLIVDAVRVSGTDHRDVMLYDRLDCVTSICDQDHLAHPCRRHSGF